MLEFPAISARISMADTATQVEETVICRLCGGGYAPTQGRSHGRIFQCWGCTNAAQSLRRNLGQSLEARGLSHEEVQDFYRALKQEKEEGGGRVQYRTIRAVLVRKLTERRLRRFEAQVEVEVLPKSVLLARGWDQGTIDRFEKEYSETYGCDAYKVPTKKMTWSEVYENVEEQLLEQEKAISQTKAQAKKEKMDVPVDEPATAGRKGGGSAEKAEAQAAKRMLTQNSKVAQEAGKWIAPLRKMPDALGKVLKQAQNAGERFEGTQEDLALLEELLTKAQKWGDAASRALLLDQQNKDAQKAGVAPTPLEPLPFAGNEAKLFQKQAQAAAASVRGNIRKKSPKAPAPDAAEPVAKRRRTKGA